MDLSPGCRVADAEPTLLVVVGRPRGRLGRHLCGRRHLLRRRSASARDEDARGQQSHDQPRNGCAGHRFDVREQGTCRSKPPFCRNPSGAASRQSQKSLHDLPPPFRRLFSGLLGIYVLLTYNPPEGREIWAAMTEAERQTEENEYVRLAEACHAAWARPST